MPQIEIPQDRDVLAKLALDILSNLSKLSRQHGVTVPKKFVAPLRKIARPTSRTLARVQAMRDKANDLSHSVDGNLEVMESSVRDIADSIIRQAGTEAAKAWGFRFGEGRARK